MNRKHPLQFEDETTPVKKSKYSPTLVFVVMWILLPCASLIFLLLGLIQAIMIWWEKRGN